MASSSPNHVVALLVLVVACTFSIGVHGQLSSTFYSRSCPTLQGLVRNVVTQAVNQDRRMAASLLRMFFHDCFVNGCDASVLLDDAATFTGEKNALPNKNSLRGFDVIDSIKTRVDAACNGTVSCADILALATLEGVAAVGGPRWSLGLGRRDATTASLSDANSGLPSPFSDLSTLISKFAAKGLSARDMTALSGGHSIGQAQCFVFRTRIYNETNIDAAFASARRANCPSTGGDSNLAPLDSTATRFDNSYFKDLVARRGLLHSDQELFNGGSQDALVRMYSTNGAAFTADFSAAMTKMSNLGPLTGTSGQIRRNCRIVN